MNDLPPGTSNPISMLAALLDRAVKAVPAARYMWGLVAASAGVAIVSILNGLTRLTFVAIVAAFVAMFIFYAFSRIEKSSDVIVKSVGRLLVIAAGLAFVFIIAASAWLALTCGPPLMAYLFGVSEVCKYGSASAVLIPSL